MNAVSSPGGYLRGRRWFSAALGVVFLAAFFSLGLQVRGLFGANGIMPASAFLDAVWNQLGVSALWQVPSLCWLNAGNTFLLGLCLVGGLLSLGLIVGRAPGACALGCWAIYLSLCSVGSPFLDFQWDALLLETALLAAAWLPWGLRPAWQIETRGQRWARWLLWWLLFRLMFESGLVKLTWGDETWWSLRALDVHFETQPLPLWPAWYAHHASRGLLHAATLVMFAIELVAPFGIFAPRRWRHAAALSLVALQVAILLTGNYAFFNLLSIALCLPLLDDGFLRAQTPAEPTPVRPPWRENLAMGVAVLAAALSLPGLLQSFRLNVSGPLAQLRSFNGYGLFRVMTTERREIVIEGSNDGYMWTAYEFPWKPGDLRRRPGLVAPHQPRVDWQMWFAALGEARQNPWFFNLLVRTLQGTSEVLAFYEYNPFPAKPPRLLRAVFYDYRFTREGEPGWWHREARGLYCPPISLRADEK